MTSINTYGDLLSHLGISDSRPTDVRVVEMSRLHEWLRMAWNLGAAAATKEVRHDMDQERVRQEMDRRANEQEAFKIRCAEALKAENRAKRKRY